MATKRRRTRLATALNRPQTPEEVAMGDALKIGVTPERLRRSGGAFELGNDREGKVLTMRDTPTGRAYIRKALTWEQCSAATKYKLHWFRAGLAGGLRTADLNGVFAGFGSRSLFASETATHHLGEYHKARNAIQKPIHAAVVEAVVCEDLALDIVGYDLGFKSKDKAIREVESILRESLDKLCKLWGL